MHPGCLPPQPAPPRAGDERVDRRPGRPLGAAHHLCLGRPVQPWVQEPVAWRSAGEGALAAGVVANGCHLLVLHRRFAAAIAASADEVEQLALEIRAGTGAPASDTHVLVNPLVTVTALAAGEERLRGTPDAVEVPTDDATWSALWLQAAALDGAPPLFRVAGVPGQIFYTHAQQRRWAQVATELGSDDHRLFFHGVGLVEEGA